MLETVFEPVEAVDKPIKPVYKECPAIVSEQVCIQADIKIYPKVKVGEIITFCDDPIIGKCGRVSCSCEPCEFTVSRTICVQIPLLFSAETVVFPAGHICGAPETEPCPLCEAET